MARALNVSWRAAYDTVGRAVARYQEVKAGKLAAAVAYYAIFSLPPLLTVAAGIAGLVYGDEAAAGTLSATLSETIGPEAAALLERALARGREASGLAIGVGSVVTLFAASGLFLALRDAARTIWGLDPAPPVPVKVPGVVAAAVRTVLTRLIGVGIVLGFGLLLVAALAAHTVAVAVLDRASELVGALAPWLPWLASLADLVLLGVGVAAFSRLVLGAPIERRAHVVGSTVTAIGLVAGNALLGWYLGSAAVGSVYGAAGALVALLVWLSYTSQIFLFGVALMWAIERAGAEVERSR